MANTLSFTANIPVANITRAKIRNVAVDEDNSRMSVLVELSSGSVVHGGFTLDVANGSCTGVAAHPTPVTTMNTVIVVALGGAGVATAYTTAVAAYQGAGADKRGSLLTALKGISGVVTGGPLDGQTVSVLPAGTVS